MSDREEFEKRLHVPDSAIWSEKKQGYYWSNFPTVAHPFNDDWEVWQEALEYARAQSGQGAEPCGWLNKRGEILSADQKARLIESDGIVAASIRTNFTIPLYTHPQPAVPEAKIIIDRVVEELENGFVACERCGDQEDTVTLDCMTDLKRLKALLSAPHHAPG